MFDDACLTIYVVPFGTIRWAGLILLFKN